MIAAFPGDRFAGDLDGKTGRRRQRAAQPVRIEFALLRHLFKIAIREWRLGLISNPAQYIRKPSPGPGRNRRLVSDDEWRLTARIDQHSNPMLRWIVGIALETGMRTSEITWLRRSQVDL